MPCRKVNRAPFLGSASSQPAKAAQKVISEIWIAGMMVKPFEDAVLTLEPGQVSDPIETQFGWHVVKLMEQRMKGAPPLDEVREELATQMRQEAVEDRVLSLTTAATIERPEIEDLDPAILKDLDLVRN